MRSVCRFRRITEGFASRPDLVTTKRAAQRLGLEEDIVRASVRLMLPFKARQRGPWLYLMADVKAALQRRGVVLQEAGE